MHGFFVIYMNMLCKCGYSSGQRTCRTWRANLLYMYIYV